MTSLHDSYEQEDDARLRQRIALQVRTFRQLKHLSQSDLARRIGVRPGPMNAIEMGKHVPSGRMLLRLSEALGVSIDTLLGRTEPSGRVYEDRPTYLCGNTPATPQPTAIPMLLRDDVKLDDVSATRVQDLVFEFLALEDACSAQKSATIPLRHPFTTDTRGIELLAQQVRQFLGIGHSVIFDYLELLENAGLRIVFCPLPESQASVAYYDAENANVFFFINEAMNAERQIFELAKRLGAVYLHTGGARPPGAQADGPRDSLRIARQFAAFFLMPEAAMRATVAQTGITPDRWTYELALRLKHRFGVSAESFVIRLEELALITEPLAKKYKARIRKEYKKTGYKEPDGTRRVLTPNGRLDDLRLIAGRRHR